MKTECRDETKPEPRPVPATEGLNRLDRDRAASLADEGGAAGAAVEAEAETTPSSTARKGRKPMLKTRS